MLLTSSRRRLEDDIAAVEAVAARPVATAQELTSNLTELYDAAYAVALDSYDVQSLARAAPELAREIFLLRLKLRDQVDAWHARGFLTLKGQRALRNALRLARYASDMLGELNIRFAQLGPDEKTLRGFSGRHHNTFINPKFDVGHDIDFRSGDVLLMRGMHHNSAAIARIGDIDSQFSHLAIIHTDENGKHWVVEALIEEGAVINPLDYTLAHGLGRCVLFRHRDEALAVRAAAHAHSIVQHSHTRRGKRIWYDFTMEMEGNTELFCSKLVRNAYAMASNGEVMLPTFGTRFDMQNRDFLDRIGVTALESFAPADIELQSDFDLVAEWQDFRVTSRLRLQDLLMDRLFLWMDEHGYRFKEDLPVRLIGLFGRLSGKLSDRAKALIADVVPKVPPNMQRSTIMAVAMLHKTAEPLLAELEALERRSVDRTGHPMHAREVVAHLETRRQEAGGRIGYLVKAD